MKRKWTKPLGEKIREALASVLPITGIVLLLSVTIAPLSAGTMVMFVFGALMLILGMGLFTVGVDMSMMPMGEGIGVEISKSRRLAIPLALCFLLGTLITIAEPDLQVLARQVPSIPNNTLIFSVAGGVGLFLAIALIRTVFSIRLSHMLLIAYGVTFLLASLIPDVFIPLSFDSGGVTTGPITVPFIMAMGIGLTSLRSDKNSQADSFGLIALCSVGSILAVLILGIFFAPEQASGSTIKIVEIATTREAFQDMLHALPEYAAEVAKAMIPIAGMFALFQIIRRRFHHQQIARVVIGFIYTYVGLVLFLTGVNEGFMSSGYLIGQAVANSPRTWLLVPIGTVIGYFIVAAEPAVHVLNKQVEEITSGSITAKEMQIGLSVGVSLSVGLAMLRIITGISIMWFMIPGYLIALVMTFFVSDMFTGVAFDSGGVASGPMTATFLSPLAMGACEALGGNMMTDAFGIVAMVAMTPLVTIQLLGLKGKLMRHRAAPRKAAVSAPCENCVIYYE